MRSLRNPKPNKKSGSEAPRPNKRISRDPLKRCSLVESNPNVAARVGPMQGDQMSPKLKPSRSVEPMDPSEGFLESLIPRRDKTELCDPCGNSIASPMQIMSKAPPRLSHSKSRNTKFFTMLSAICKKAKETKKPRMRKKI